MHCCVIRGECGLEGFLDLGPGFICFSDVFVIELGEPSLSKGFFLSLGHPVVENHSSCCIKIFVLMQGKVGLHSHEPSVGISDLSAELFKEGCFNFNVVVFFVSLRIYMNGGLGRTRGGEVWRTGR